MARRKFREERSKFQGVKQVLQDLNLPAHAIVHDTDVSLPGAAATGYTLVWSSNVVMLSGDLSQAIFAPEDGELQAVYCSLPAVAIDAFSVDVYKNGVSIFSGALPTVQPGDSFSADVTDFVDVEVLARDAFEVEITGTGDNYGRAMVYIVIG